MEVLRFWAKTADHQVDFLLTGGQPGIFDDEAKKMGARIFYLRYSRSTLFKFIKEFRRILRANQYDAVHDHQDYAAGWHLLVGLGALPPVRVVHVHNPWSHIEVNYETGPLRKFTTLMGRRLVSYLATHICGTSGEVLRLYGFEPGHREPAVTVLHCGFDVARFNSAREFDRQSVRAEFGWTADAKIILFVGRLDRTLSFDHPQNHKNSWFALNVGRAAFARDPSITLLMAGAGGAPDALNEAVRDWSLTDKFRLLGLRSDIPRLMRAADVLLFPSRQEGLGMVAVEAQAAGLPVLASTAVPRECVVIPELYDSLPLSESLETWADALLSVIKKPRPSLKSCHDTLNSSDFSIENSARKLEEIYRSARS